MAYGGVWMIEAATLRVVGFLPTGAGAHGLYPSRDARRLYVSNRGAGTVSVISFASRRIIATWHIPRGTPDMGGVSADGSTLWLSGRYRSEVYAIDTRTGRLRARIRVGSAHTASASGHNPAATRSGTLAFCAEKTIAQNGTRRSGRVQGREPSLTACLLSASSRRS